MGLPRNKDGSIRKNLIDLTGKTFGLWKVQKFSYTENTGIKKSTRSYWQCICECGKIFNIDGSALRDGSSKSCWSCRGKIKKQNIEFTR